MAFVSNIKVGDTTNGVRAVAIPFGQVDSTSTSTAFTATIPGITELKNGVCVFLKNGVVTSASGCTLNINGLGAKPIYNTMATATAVTTTFNSGYTMLFVYDETRVSGGCWMMYYGYNSSGYTSNVAQGQCYGTCSTAVGTAAKTVSMSSYALVAHGICAIKFTNGNTAANPTLNINSKGAKAIYWNGANGRVKNCNFSNNVIRGIEDDPFDKEEEIVMEDGTIIHTIRFRQMGAKITEGGAIVWNGTNGTVLDCVFRNNHVGYANSGGAIQWKGDNGKILKSQFYQNDAWCGAAVCWVGDNGFISESTVMDNGFFDGGIYWFGKNGTIVHSILVGNGYPLVLRSSEKLTAEYNFWGDTIYNISKVEKPDFVSKWLVLNYNHDGKFILKGDNITVRYDLSYLVDKDGNVSRYSDASGLYDGEINYTAERTGYLDITFDNGIKIKIDAREAIVSSDVTKYYQNSKISFKVTVYDFVGKVVSKKVKFTVNGKNYFVETDKNGVATLKLKFKPGKYTVYSSYGDAKVKNKIIVKNTLITKNIYKKFKKSGKFYVKVLNSKGKTFAKKVVKISFKGKTYKIKTNKKGIATLKISKNLKIGKHIIKTTYNGLTNTNKIIVKK